MLHPPGNGKGDPDEGVDGAGGNLILSGYLFWITKEHEGFHEVSRRKVPFISRWAFIESGTLLLAPLRKIFECLREILCDPLW
jgi:hypothetical protein